MTYYADLLTSAFAFLSGESTPKVLSLIACDDAIGGGASPDGIRQLEFPTSLLPLGAELHSLPDGESFVEQARLAVADSSARCVFVFPPVMGNMRLSDNWRSRFGRLGIAEAVAESLIGAEGVDALAMLVPAHFMGSMRSGEWRRHFFPAHSAVVIEHDHDNAPQAVGLPIHSTVRFSTVVFRRHPGPIRFFKITAEALAESAQQLASNMHSLLRQPAGKTRYGYIYPGELDLDYPCSYDYYSEETEQLRQEVGLLGERVPLSSVADILMGFATSHPDREMPQGQTGFLFINARDITRDGRVDLSEVQTQSLPSLVRHYLEDGNFCIRQISQADGGFIVGIFEGDGRPITFSRNVIVVRPRASLNPAQRQVL